MNINTNPLFNSKHFALVIYTPVLTNIENTYNMYNRNKYMWQFGFKYVNKDEHIKWSESEHMYGSTHLIQHWIINDTV